MCQELRSFLANRPGFRREFAKTLGVTAGHLAHVCSGVRRPGPKLALAIEKATDHAVTREQLRPDIWAEDDA